MVFRNSVLIKSLCKRAILTNAWILGKIVKLQFDKGEISFWLTVKSLLIDINTLNATKLVQLIQNRIFILDVTASILQDKADL